MTASCSSWRARTGRVVVFYLALLSLSPALAAEPAEPLETAMQAVEAGDYTTAARLYRPLAEAGNAEAQHNLAILYRTGRGVEKDLQQSRHWFLRAAEQGVADAQYYLGYIYDNGEGVTANPQYAFLWYRKAAEQGHPLAQVNLGVMYAGGSGVAQDLEQAYVWFSLAAAQGQGMAFRNRQLLAEQFTEEQRKALRARSRQYFQKYLWPFQQRGMMRGHPQAPEERP